jgi:hypothetical protein
VVPEDPTQEVIVPTITIIEPSEEMLQLMNDLRPPTLITLFDYETALSLGFFSISNVGICME